MKIDPIAVAVLICFNVQGAPVNVALGKPTSANSHYSSQVPSNVVDGLIDGSPSPIWSAGDRATTAHPNWLQIDLQQIHHVESIVIYGNDTSNSGWNYYTVDFTLRLSRDGITWKDIGSGQLVDPPGVNPTSSLRSETFDISGEEYRFVRFVSTGGEHWTTVNEIQVFGSLLPMDDYHSWRELSFGSDYPDPSKELLVWGDDADPERDGLTNLLEFIMGLDPLVSDSHLGPRIRIEGGEAVFTYPRITATDHDVIAYVSWSSDLEHWTSGGVLYSLAEHLGDTLLIEARLIVPVDGRVFMRLEALRTGGP